MTDYRVLDLFAGLGGFSSAFAESECWRVTTVDINERFDPDIQADVFKLRPSDFSGRAFDVVLAGFPCQFMTTARNLTEGGDPAWSDGDPRTDNARDNVALLYHSVGLIRGLAPTYWFLENPRGMLRTRWHEPTATVWYCQYGEPNAKPTDLWGRHPPMTYRTCHYGNDDCHESGSYYSDGSDRWEGEGRVGTLGERDPAERAKVPHELSAAIRDACEAVLDGEVAEQVTLEEVTA